MLIARNSERQYPTFAPVPVGIRLAPPDRTRGRGLDASHRTLRLRSGSVAPAQLIKMVCLCAGVVLVCGPGLGGGLIAVGFLVLFLDAGWVVIGDTSSGLGSLWARRISLGFSASAPG